MCSPPKEMTYHTYIHEKQTRFRILVWGWWGSRKGEKVSSVRGVQRTAILISDVLFFRVSGKLNKMLKIFSNFLKT